MLNYYQSYIGVTFLYILITFIVTYFAFRISKRKYIPLYGVVAYVLTLLVSIFVTILVQKFFNDVDYLKILFISIFQTSLSIFVIWFSLYSDKTIHNLIGYVFGYYMAKFAHLALGATLKVSELRIAKNIIGTNQSLDIESAINLAYLNRNALTPSIKPLLNILPNILAFIVFFSFVLLLFNLIYKSKWLDKKMKKIHIPFLKQIIIFILGIFYYFIFSNFAGIDIVYYLLWPISFIAIFYFLRWYYNKNFKKLKKELKEI